MSSCIFRAAAGLLLVACFALSGCGSLFYQPNRERVYFDPDRMGVHPEDVWLTAEDGVRFHSWYLDADPTAKPKALVLFFHGNAENLTSHYSTLLWLLPHGIDFWVVDFRGYGKSEGNPDAEGTVADARAAIEAAGRKSRELGAPLVVLGQSLGGAVALKALIDVGPEGRSAVRLVVADSTFLSYRDAARFVLGRHGLTSWLRFLVPVLVANSMAPGARVAELAPIPLVVIHGDQDSVVGFELGRSLFAAAADPKEFWVVPGGGHIDAFWRPGQLYRRRFLERVLKLTAPLPAGASASGSNPG